MEQLTTTAAVRAEADSIGIAIEHYYDWLVSLNDEQIVDGLLYLVSVQQEKAPVFERVDEFEDDYPEWSADDIEYARGTTLVNENLCLMHGILIERIDGKAAIDDRLIPMGLDAASLTLIRYFRDGKYWLAIKKDDTAI